MEEENKQTQTWVSSKCKKGKFCDTFLAFCELLRACLRAKFSQSHQECWLILSCWPTQHPSPQNKLLLSSRLSASPDFCRLPCSVHFSVLPLSLFYLHLLTDFFCSLLGPSFPCPLPILWEILHANPVCGFRTKTDKGIFWLALTHTHTTNAHIMSHYLPDKKLWHSYVLSYEPECHVCTKWIEL